MCDVRTDTLPCDYLVRSEWLYSKIRPCDAAKSNKSISDSEGFVPNSKNVNAVVRVRCGRVLLSSASLCPEKPAAINCVTVLMRYLRNVLQTVNALRSVCMQYMRNVGLP